MENSSIQNELHNRLTQEQKAAFHKALKIAVYKELYRQKKITDTQLSWLIELQAP